MITPNVPSSDVVVAEMATTAGTTIDNPPEIVADDNLSAVEQQNEKNAILETTVGVVEGESVGKREEEANNEVVEGFQHVKIEEDARPIVITDDAAIPATSDELPLDLGLLPVSLPDFSQMGPIDSLLAYAQPFPLLPAMDYGLALPNDLGAAEEPFLDASPYIHEQEETRISAYAKLEFPDGEFYMNTYSVILGRDQKAMREALRREQEERKRIDEEAAAAREPKTPNHLRREHSKYSKSVVSESGGILREVDGVNPEKRRKGAKKSKSTGSSSRLVSRRNSLIQPTKTFDYQAQPISSHNATENGARPNLAALRPDPHDCPLVNIHPPATESVSGYKAISRQHVKIAYSLKKRLFEAQVLGRNGAFVEEVFYHEGEVVELKSGSFLQIGEVMVRFVLPDVAIGETGAERSNYEEYPVSERYSEGGKEMSFDFEDSIHDGIVRETSSSDDEKQGSDVEEEEIVGSGDEEPEPEEAGLQDASDQSSDGDEEEEDDQVIPSTEVIPQQGLIPDRKRGPGRPPKDGISSKREKQLMKKAVKTAAETGQSLAEVQAQLGITSPIALKTEASLQESPTGKTEIKMETLPDGTVVPVKNKVGRPRKHPRPDTPPIQKEKRKYTKRKPKEPKEGEGVEGEEGEEGKKEKKEKPTKPPRSPSPTFNEADLTAEQLAKPQANYVTLIHEALSSSAAGMMSLPQIYRAIMRKYPFFVLKCSTTGWQSSVRHNLSQHHAFKKVERDGKGWMWAIVEGVSIEKEKKRRITPPPSMQHGQMHHQQIYQAGHPPHMMNGQYPIPPPGYMLHPNMRPGQPYMGPPMNGHPYPHPTMHMPPHQHPPGLFPAISQMAAIAPPQQYSSPYGPKPGAAPPPPPPNAQTAPQPTAGTTPAGTLPVSAVQPITGIAAAAPPMANGVSNNTQPPPQLTQHQSPYANHSHPPPAQYHPGVLPQNVTPSQAPGQPGQPPVVSPMPPSRPQHPQTVLSAVEAFRSNLLASLKDKTENAEAILSSAINRALGYSKESSVPGDSFEPRIYDALQTILVTIPEFKPVQSTSQTANGVPISTGGAPPTNPGNSAQSSTPTPTIARPSFSSVARPAGNSIPRPSMTPAGASPGLLRVNSSSPAVVAHQAVSVKVEANATSVPPVVAPTAVTPLNVTEAAQPNSTAGASETLADTQTSTVLPFPTEPMELDNKDTSTALPGTGVEDAASLAEPAIATAILSVPPATTAPEVPPKENVPTVGNAAEAFGQGSTSSGSRQKRQIDQVEDETHDEPDFKRVATSGPPPVKT